MIEPWVPVVLTVAALVPTVWLYFVQRSRDERSLDPDPPRRVGKAAFLAAFLPLVALLTLLQQYLEEPRGIYLALMPVALLALLAGLPRLAERTARRHRRPGRK